MELEHTGVSWPSLCPYLCLCWGVENLFFWLSLEVRRAQHRGWKADSFPTKAVPPSLAASCPTARQQGHPQVPELLQTSRAERLLLKTGW